MPQANAGAVLEQDRQFEQLTGEVIAKLEKVNQSFSQLDERMQKQFAEHVKEITKLGDRMAGLDKSYQARFSAMQRDPSRAQRVLQSAGLETPEKIEAAHAAFVTLANKGDTAGALAGLQKAALGEALGPGGGFLMSEELATGIMNNLERYGVVERLVAPMPISGEMGSVMRLSTGATVYYPDEGAAPSESAPKLSGAQLRPTRHSVYVLFDRWFLRSKPTFLAFIIEEMRRALAQAQDQNVFAGDGTSAYARHLGVFKRTAGTIVTADAGDDTYAEVIDKTTYYLAKQVGGMPESFEMWDPRFFMHRSFFFSYLGARDSNGKPIADFFVGGARQLWGYPVEVVQASPNKLSDASQASKVISAFGPLARAWGGVRHISGIELRSSDQVKFLEGQIAVVLDVPQRYEEIDPTAMQLLSTHS